MEILHYPSTRSVLFLKCAKFIFGRVSAPAPLLAWAHDALPDPLVGWEDGYHRPIRRFKKIHYKWNMIRATAGSIIWSYTTLDGHFYSGCIMYEVAAKRDSVTVRWPAHSTKTDYSDCSLGTADRDLRDLRTVGVQDLLTHAWPTAC